MSDIALLSAGTNSLECQATGLPDDAAFIRWYIGTDASDMPYDGYCDAYSADWPCYTFTGLEPDTTYLVKISVRDADQSALEDAVTRSFTTAPAIVIIKQPVDVTAIVGDTATFSVTARGTDLTYQWQYKTTASGSSWRNSTIGGPNTDTLSVGAVAARNGYQYRCIITDGSGESVISDAATLTITTAASRPDDWEWESNVTAGAEFSMTAAEWNRFIDRLYAFAAYKNTPLSGSASDYYVTKGTDMLASQANSVRSLVETLNPPTEVPASVSSENAITAAFFNGLRDSLNSIV